MNKTQLGLLFYFTVMLSSTANSQDSLDELAIDQTATEAIRAATTDEAYLTRWVDSLPEHPAIPSPRGANSVSKDIPGARDCRVFRQRIYPAGQIGFIGRRCPNRLRRSLVYC
jgi:hypothetical protein